MKKKSRFLTGLLSAVMALSLFALPAAAAGEEGTTPTPPASTIDTNRTGSITIHKYVMENISGETPTGENNQTVPKGAETIEGVGFTIYRVMSDTELTAYYAGNSKVGNVTVDTYVKDVGGVKTVKKNDAVVAKYGNEQKTDDKGVTTFTNLPVGLYVVMETTKPAAVTAAVEPFLVSIPMTRVATNTANKEWLYDVHVYPKNSTKKGSIKLVKKGATGDKSDANATTLNGVTFDLYWYDDTNTEWKKVKPNLTTSDGEISVSDLQTGKYKFVETSNTNSGYIVDLSETYEFEIDSDGKLALPTKLEKATNANDYAIDKDSATITIYNYKPDADKEVLKRGGNKDDDVSWVEGTDYNVGDTISYRISVVVPSNIAKLGTFEVTDTPDHLTDDMDSIIVKCGTESLAKGTAYSVEAVDKGFKINFTSAQIADCAGKTIIITYDATLDNDAVTTIDGNVNTAKLIYTNKIGTDGKPNEGSKEEIHDQTIVYTFKIDIEKVSDQKVDGKPEKLSGVKFDLYKKVDAETKDAVKGSAIGITDATDREGYYVKVGDQLTTNGKGETSKAGLSKGTYYLLETETKPGYNLLKEPVKVKLNIDYEEEWTESKKYEHGVLTKHDTKVNRKQYFGTTKSTTEGNVKTTIINRKGFDLPVTGGFGTLLFSGIGALLVVGGIGVLMSIKKKKGNA